MDASMEEEITVEHFGKFPDRLKMDVNADILEKNMKEYSEKYPDNELAVVYGIFNTQKSVYFKSLLCKAITCVL